MMQTHETGAPASKIQTIRAAYAAGEGGYGTLAKRFGIRRDTVRRYVNSPDMTDPVFQSCRRKQRHAARSEAESALARMIAECATDRERTCQVYACAHCGGWHVGHPSRMTEV